MKILFVNLIRIQEQGKTRRNNFIITLPTLIKFVNIKKEIQIGTQINKLTVYLKF